MLLPYKGELLHTITTDNGSEFAAHEWLTRQLGAQVYFADSYASWQKGAVGNTNKLIRQYIRISILSLTRESHQYRPKLTENQGQN